MKRVRCPKCENYICFDEQKYEVGQSLVFVCEECGKQFSIKLGTSKLKASRKEEAAEDFNEDVKSSPLGYLHVIENVFGFKQLFALKEGDNMIGRRCVGTGATIPIETSDTSVDHAHCVINVKRNKKGKMVYTLRDNDSLTGTFLGNELLGEKDRLRLEDGAIVSIGATTFIFYAPSSIDE